MQSFALKHYKDCLSCLFKAYLYLLLFLQALQQSLVSIDDRRSVCACAHASMKNV